MQPCTSLLFTAALVATKVLNIHLVNLCVYSILPLHSIGIQLGYFDYGMKRRVANMGYVGADHSKPDYTTSLEANHVGADHRKAADEAADHTEAEY